MLATRYASENVPSTVVVGEVADGDVDPLGARLGLQLGDHRLREVDPVHGTPRAASGKAIRPVPMPSSSAEPPCACSTRKSTIGSTTSGLSWYAYRSSKRSATSGPKWSTGHHERSTRTALTLYSGVPISGSPTSCVSQFTFCSAKWSDIQTSPG